MRACAELMGATDLLSLNPAILKPDASAIQARRILDKLIRREAQAEVGELA